MGRLLRFGLTGALTTAIAFVVFVALMRSGLHYALASVASWASGLAAGFAINRRFTFQIAGSEHRKRDFALYATGAALQLLLGLAGYALLIGRWRLNPTTAFVLNTTMTATFSFLFLRFVTFRRVAIQRNR
jgi:putative flippase GtrA